MTRKLKKAGEYNSQNAMTKIYEEDISLSISIHNKLLFISNTRVRIYEVCVESNQTDFIFIFQVGNPD